MKEKDGTITIHLHRQLKIAYCLFLFSIISLQYRLLDAQTTNISGIVNSYYPVIQILPANDGVRVSNATGLSQHDKIMIVQMKGASVNTANTASFGDTSSLNNAGNYEIATICSIQGDTVYLFFNLLNQYTISGKVQLVKFAEYASAAVVDTIKAAPWDNTTGTGGVIAISVTSDLTLNAPVYADSSGYRGGSFKLSNGTCSNGSPANSYYYDANNLSPQNGGFKGEGVFDISAAQSGGRGAPANGGGGGNNHNNGGAGGANLSNGGKGGGNSSNIGCTAELHGEAGKALSSWGGTKIFFGGGGGAGHANNGFVASPGGGHGGGIVFIQANDLISNNSRISANGQVGGPALSDGASGGGAGGTIIMNVFNSYSGTLSIETNGGAGGTEDDGGNIKRCYGAGGGGSGGAVYFTGAPPVATITAAAGAAGVETSRDAGCSAAVPALPGSAGSIINFYIYSRSFDPAGSCHSVLPVQLISFNATANQQKVLLHWKLANPELALTFLVQKMVAIRGWVTMQMVSANDIMQEYTSVDEDPFPGNNQYRLKIIEKDNSFFYSPARLVYFDGARDQFDIYPNPATGRITITGNFSSGTDVTLTDLSGRLLLQRKLAINNVDVEMDLSPIAAGMYLLRINNTIKKLVIR
jgi:Secretion system C-terminal sorting domain